MPIYEYVCNSCKHKFEKMRPFSKANEGADCPRCQSKAERIISVCYSKSADSHGSTQPLGGGSSCASCGSGNCSSCGH
jgi:putative FmdB family regulatory protein